MGWFTTFIDSSLGKKLVMALTGFFLILFLIVHLTGNLSLFKGDAGETYNVYSLTLRSLPFIVFLEAGLFLIFLFHIINGIRLWIENRRARPVRYAVKISSPASDVYSRTMVLTGSVIFIFLVIHLRTFFVPAAITGHPGTTLFQLVVEAFKNPLYSGFYVIAMILLGFHLNHGFQSAFQTFGWNHNKYFSLIQKIGTIYAIVMAAGFASMPIYFLFFYGGGN